MATEVLGIFDTDETAAVAEKSLSEAGFSSAQVRRQSYEASAGGDSSSYSQALSHGQTLLAVTVSDNVSEDKALHILRQSGAIKVNEIETRFHAGTKSS